MSTISSLPGGKLVAAVKGAPETIKKMLESVPHDYDDTYKWYTRQGSRVLALGMKEMEPLSLDKVGLQSDRFAHFFAYLFPRSTNFTGQMLKASFTLLGSWCSIAPSSQTPSSRLRCLLTLLTVYVVMIGWCIHSTN